METNIGLGRAPRPEENLWIRSGFVNPSLWLARISRQLPAATGDAPCPVVFSRIGMLDGLSSTAARPSGRKPHWTQHLAGLATKVGEKCGLAYIRCSEGQRSHIRRGKKPPLGSGDRGSSLSILDVFYARRMVR